MENYQIVDSDVGLGACLIAGGNWDTSLLDVIRKNNVKHLRLSSSMGWEDNDVHFLRDLKGYGLKGVEIYSWENTDLSPLDALLDLSFIGVEVNLKQELDLSVFEQLRTLKARWSKNIINIHLCAAMESLNIVNYPFEDLTVLKDLRRLRSLAITSNKLKRLEGMAPLKHLKAIDFFSCVQLEDVEELGVSRALEEITMEKCRKISVLPDLSKLEGVRKISLNDCGAIESLKALKNCKMLENLFFLGDTNVLDGELSFLEKMPSLKECWFANRRHYTVTRETLPVNSRTSTL